MVGFTTFQYQCITLIIFTIILIWYIQVILVTPTYTSVLWMGQNNNPLKLVDSLVFVLVKWINDLILLYYSIFSNFILSMHYYYFKNITQKIYKKSIGLWYCFKVVERLLIKRAKNNNFYTYLLVSRMPMKAQSSEN